MCCVAVAIPLADSDNVLDADLDLENSASELQDNSNDDDEGTVDLDAACNGCGAGQQPASQGSSRCVPCPPGRYQDGCLTNGRGLCSVCPDGKTTLSFGSTKLSDCVCGPNTFFSATSANTKSKCASCPAGTQFIPSNSKPAAASVADCTPCPAGSAPSFASMGRTGEGCQLCPRGSFAASPRSSSCTSCPRGTFAKFPGSTSCAACPSNHVALGVTGQESGGVDCQCRIGTFTSGPSQCTPCPAGTIADKVGSNRCRLCPIGTQAYGGTKCCAPSKWRNGVCRK